MSLFKSDKLIEIVLEYYESPSGKITVLETEEEKKKYEGKSKKLKTKWLQETWKSNNEATRGSMIFNSATGMPTIDWTKLAEYKLLHLLKEWDVTDDDGEKVPCNEEMKNMLDPDIAQQMLAAYNRKTQISEEELGN